MLTWLSAFFHSTEVTQDYGRWHYVIVVFVCLLGCCLRFWGLDNVGLHGDEETMAMPALSLLETGQPLLPSGMYYARALAQIYLMAGSVLIFGESEWALRLPSAIIGSLGIVVAFFLGRRFLPPRFNIAFIAIIALLPVFIEVSQTARMYIFWLTSLMLFGVMVFRWERDGRLLSLILALCAWLLALHFHQLSIFAVLLFLFPGLNRQCWRQLIAGVLAAGVGLLTFSGYSEWISSKYPSRNERSVDSIEEFSIPVTPLQQMSTDHLWLIVIGLLSGLVLFILALRYTKRPFGGQVVAVALLATAYVACVTLHYHIGGILLMFGVITWLRTYDGHRGWLIAILIMIALLAIVQILLLNDSGNFPGRKLIGALVGSPSVWPTLRFAEFSPFGFGLYAALVLVAFVNLAQRKSIPDHFLLFGIAVWAQLIAVGFFKWYVPPRYVMGALPFFLLCYVAGAVYLSTIIPALNRLIRHPIGTWFAALVIVLVAVNPIAVARAVNAGYERHPDHKGAAEFLQAIPVSESDILIAEDVLQQTYYMGEVDYWLVNKEVAQVYSVVEDGVLYDQYTHVEAIGTGDELLRVLDKHANSQVYVIGSGENHEDGRRYMRGHGILEVLESGRLEVVHTGRDKKTRIWRARKL